MIYNNIPKSFSPRQRVRIVAQGTFYDRIGYVQSWIRNTQEHLYDDVWETLPVYSVSVGDYTLTFTADELREA